MITAVLANMTPIWDPAMIALYTLQGYLLKCTFILMNILRSLMNFRLLLLLTCLWTPKWTPILLFGLLNLPCTYVEHLQCSPVSNMISSPSGLINRSHFSSGLCSSTVLLLVNIIPLLIWIFNFRLKIHFQHYTKEDRFPLSEPLLSFLSYATLCTVHSTVYWVS